MSALQHSYQYAGQSQLSSVSGLSLVGADNEAAPGFFQGRLVYARATALCLRGISEIVAARFYTPPNMLARILAEADPVVTASREFLRFEGFSACCSTYARLDVCADGFEADEISPGTTNVDFNAPLRAALAKIRSNDDLGMTVRADAVTVDTPDEEIVEKKVPLPVRWIKGLGEVQAHMSGMSEVLAVSKVAALQFLRSLPRSGGKHRAWVVPAGKGLRLAQRETAKSVPLVSPERLRALEPLVTQSTRLRVFSGKAGSSAWVLDLPGQRFTLVVSPERWRGFSGEGQLLKHLAAADADALVKRVEAGLKWQDHIDPQALAEECGVGADSVQTALSVLASRGLVGFDLHQGGYFHRVLPFDLSKIEALNPRLKSARKLIEEGGIELSQSKAGVTATVPSKDVVHRVTLAGEASTCTCPWFAKHQGERGPCKHVLAVEMLTEEGDA